ncbi:hypothetical protein RZ76_03530 [Apilactobacillus kunkeei]|uniref:LPXTG cell wall anchor domain-containing protein n=1 Tax=Apilactobacillus kunkeei TaxID=148814 RepID=UPI0006CE8070|nr:LPXTG cell wall anchor domain-containing protein [Apilactobacillus kunkeei]KPN80505.1 hypothetical protein RZ76_03530 [Apilactobacillus kunkeei]
MKKSIKTALLFSTLIIGAVETPNVINNTSSATQVIAHADDTSTPRLNAFKNLSIVNGQNIGTTDLQNIIINSISEQTNQNISSVNDVTEAELDNLNTLYFPSPVNGVGQFAKNVDFNQLKGIINPQNITSIYLQKVLYSTNPFKALGEMDSLKYIQLVTSNVTNEDLAALKAPNLQGYNFQNIDVSDLSQFIANNNLSRTTNGSPQIQATAVGTHANDTDAALVGLHGSSVSDLSPLNGQMLYSSAAMSNGYSITDFAGQVINRDFTIDTPKAGTVIKIPINDLKDVTAKSTSNSGVDYQAVYNPSVTYLTANNFSDKNISVIGKDGKPAQSQATTNQTNGIAYLEYKYDGGNIPSTLSFNFISTLGTSALNNLFTGTYNINLNVRPENPQSSSADSQSQSSASSNDSSSAQSSSASSEQTSSSSASKESSSASSEQVKPSSEAQSSSASKEATSSASSSQSIPASNESKAASSSAVASSSSSAAETSNSTTVESSHSNNKGTQKKDNVQPKKVETTNSSEHKDAKSLPQTGDQTHQNVFVALGSLLVAISATMLAFVLRRKNK